jgi:glucarate dehydratase
MQIVEMRVHCIAVADPPLRSSYGLHAPYALRTIIELESEDGIIGISETHGGDAIAQGFEALRSHIVGSDAYQLAGKLMPMIAGMRKGTSPDRSQTFHVPGENPFDASQRLYSAVEIACLDLIGKSVGQPVCDLLGGRVRDSVPFSAYLFFKHAGGGGQGADSRRHEDEYGEVLTPQALVAQARQMTAKCGFRNIKLKAGVLDPAIEIESMRQLRAAFGPSVPLRMDPNCAWSIETSACVGQTLAEELSGDGYLEDPTATMEGMAEVRHKLAAAGVSTPLASNVAVTSFADLHEAVTRDAVQIVLSDPHYWGGLRQTQHLGQACRSFGLGLSMHSNTHLGVSLMAMTHAAAATFHLSFACDTHYPWQSAQDEIVAGGRIPIVDGCVRVPDKPGLGVELDHDQLARGRERYAKCRYRRRDDEAEMREHVDPKWRRVLPRW